MIQNKSILVVCNYDEFRVINTELHHYAGPAGITVDLMHAEGYNEAAAKMRAGLPYDAVLTTDRITYDWYGVATQRYVQQLRDIVEDKNGVMFHSLLPGCEGVSAFVKMLKRGSKLQEGTYEGAYVNLTWRSGINVCPIEGEGIRGLTFENDGLVVVGKVLVRSDDKGKMHVVAQTRYGHSFHLNPTSVARVEVMNRH